MKKDFAQECGPRKREGKFFFTLRAALVFLCILYLVQPGAASVQASPGKPAAQEIHDEINRMRRKVGLDPLRVDEAAQTAAAAYAERIAAEGRFAHIDLEGNRAVQRYRAAGGASLVAGEILGKGPNLAAVAEAWRESREHVSLILHPLWTHAGAGSQTLSGGGTVWVVVFTEKHLEDISISFPEGGVRIEGTADGVEEPIAEVNGVRADIEIAGELDAAHAGRGESDRAVRRFVIETDENAFLYFLRFGYLAADGYPVFTESYRFERPDS